jgi:hypothetical protein
MAASVTKEVDESGGGEADGMVGIVGVAGAVGVVGLIVVDGAVFADGLMIVEGNDGALITVGTGRDLRRRCASVMCVRILLILSVCAGTPGARGTGSALVEGVVIIRGTGVAAGEGVDRGA